MRILIAIISAILLVSSNAGCSSIDKVRRENQLEASNRAYLTALRWGDFLTAIEFFSPELRASDDWSRNFQDLRVSRYEIQRPMLIAADGSATQTVMIEYVFQYNQVVHRVRDDQVWKWDEKERRWWLTTGFPF